MSIFHDRQWVTVKGGIKGPEFSSGCPYVCSYSLTNSDQNSNPSREEACFRIDHPRNIRGGPPAPPIFRSYRYYYASAPPWVGALSDDAVWSLTSCLSVAYIGPKSRTERPRKTKIGTEVAHVTRNSDTTLKVKRSKVKVTGVEHIVAAYRTACCILVVNNFGCSLIKSIRKFYEFVKQCCHIRIKCHLLRKQAVREAAAICLRPAASWPLTFWPWKWCPSHVWRGLPLCQF